MFKTLVLPFLQSMSETAFLIYVIYLGLYSVKSHNSQKMLNLTYAWFLTIAGEAENEGEYRVGVQALQSGRKGRRKNSEPLSKAKTRGRLQNAAHEIRRLRTPPSEDPLPHCTFKMQNGSLSHFSMYI